MTSFSVMKLYIDRIIERSRDKKKEKRYHISLRLFSVHKMSVAVYKRSTAAAGKYIRRVSVYFLNFYGAARRGFMRSCRPRRRWLVAAEGLTGQPTRWYIDLRVVHIAFGPASLVGGSGSIVRVFRL